VALVLGGVVANLLFMVTHVESDPWLWPTSSSSVPPQRGGLADRRSGGAVRVHTVNNLFTLVPLALFGDISSPFQRGGAGEPIMILPMTVIVLVAGC